MQTAYYDRKAKLMHVKIVATDVQILAYALRCFSEQMNANGGDDKGRDYAQRMEALRKDIIEAM